MHIRGSRRFKHHQNSTRRRHLERDRKSENGGGRGKKSAKFWAPNDSGPHLRGPIRSPTLRASTLRDPTLRALTFSRSGPLSPTPLGFRPFGPPLLRAPPFGPPPFDRRYFLWVWAPAFPHFYHVAHLFFFFCFFNLCLVIFWKFHCFCWFSPKKTFLFFAFLIFQVGEEGSGANPNPKLVYSFGEEVTNTQNPN